MKLYKISSGLFIIGILIKLIQTFTDLKHTDTILVSAAAGTVIGIAICIAVLAITMHWLSRYQRVVKEMSESYPAWLCILEAQTSYRIISINNDVITLSRLYKGYPQPLMTWPRQLASISKQNVQASVFKSFDGIAISSAENERPTVKMLFYEPTSTLFAKPMQSNELDTVITQLEGHAPIETMLVQTHRRNT